MAGKIHERYREPSNSDVMTVIAALFSFCSDHREQNDRSDRYENQRLFGLNYSCVVIIVLIIHSKYFPVSDWLKPHS